MMNDKKTTLIFDFDGVLVDSKELIFNGLNNSLSNLNLKPITPQEFSSKSKQELLKERNIGKCHSIIILLLTRRYLFKRYKEIKINFELIELLKTFNGNLFILSSNSTKLIKKVLKKDQYIFKKIIGGAGLNNKHKYLMKLPKESIYITDEVRDVLECKKSKTAVYGVSWGLDTEAELSQAGVLRVFQNISEIESIF